MQKIEFRLIKNNKIVGYCDFNNWRLKYISCKDFEEIPTYKPIVHDKKDMFSGLYDKEKKKIYGGDIVDTRYGRYVVEWNEVMCGFTPFCFGSNAPDPETETEIIGNRYHDPKLI